MMEVSEELMLTWGSHQQTLMNELAQLRHQGCFADVTLACGGRLYLAHKFILAMCSDYFRNIFGPSGVGGGSNSTLVIVLKDVACHDVEHLLDYMYTGVVSVEKSELHSLIRTAENLQIKGLAFADSPDAPPPPSPERTDGSSSLVGAASRSEDGATGDQSTGSSRRGNIMAPDVRLNRPGTIASRVPVNSREGTSPPSKRKRLQDSMGQTINNSSNTSTTFSNSVRTSCSASQQQPLYTSKRRVSSPNTQAPFSTSSSIEGPVMPHFTEPQSPLPPGSPLQFRHTGGPVGIPVSLPSKSFRDSPDGPLGLPEHHPHHQSPSSSLPSGLSSQPDPLSVGHSPKVRTTEAEGLVQRPENLEIKKEEPDGDTSSAVSTEILVAVDGPSNEASELKEEPLPEEGESGPSGLHAGLDCWGAAAGAEGGLLADAADDDDVSDTDGTGVHLLAKSTSRDTRPIRGPSSPSKHRRKNEEHHLPQQPHDDHFRRRESGDYYGEEYSRNELRLPSNQEKRGDVYPQRYHNQNSSAMKREGHSLSLSKQKLGDKANNAEDDNDIIEIIGSSRVKNSTTGYRTNDQVVNDSSGDMIFQDGGICGFLEGFEPGTYLPPDGEFLAGVPHREEYLLSTESLNATVAQTTNAAQDQMRYTCQFCGRNFDRMSNLKRHLLLHSGSKPFQCLYCEYRAAQKVNVVQHMANRHKDEMTGLLRTQVNINDLLVPKD